jgi:hypothetical protein
MAASSRARREGLDAGLIGAAGCGKNAPTKFLNTSVGCSIARPRPERPRSPDLGDVPAMWVAETRQKPAHGLLMALRTLLQPKSAELKLRHAATAPISILEARACQSCACWKGENGPSPADIYLPAL